MKEGGKQDTLRHQGASLTEDSSSGGAWRDSPPAAGGGFAGLGGEGWRSVIRSAVAGMLQITPEGRFAFVNPHWCEMLGYTEQELLQLGIVDVTHPESLPETLEKFARMVAGGPDFTIEQRYLRKDGSEMWGISSVSGIRDECGTVCRILAVVNDISAQKYAENRSMFLADLATRLAALRDGGEIIRIATEAAGTYLGVKRCFFAEVYGSEHRIVVGRNWVGDDAVNLEGDYDLAGFGPPDWWELCANGRLSVSDVMDDPLTRGQAAGYAGAGIRAYAAEPFRREDRHPTVMLAVTDHLPRVWRARELSLLQDVAARVWPLVQRARAEVALRDSEAEFRTMFELSGVGKAQSDPATDRFIRVNHKLGAILDYHPQDLVGRTIAQVTHPDDHEHCQRLRHALFSGEVGEYSSELRLVTSTGRTVWVELSATMIRDALGRPLRTIAVIQDITARKLAEQSLAEENEDLQSLQEISTRLISEGDHTELLRQIVKAAVGVTDADKGAIQCYDQDGRELTMLHSEGFAVGEEMFGLNGDGCPVPGVLAVTDGRRVVIRDCLDRAEGLSAREVEAFRRAGARAAQATPLIARSGRLIGVLTSLWVRPHDPPPRIVRVLDVLARQAADLVEHLQDEQTLRHSEERFRVLVETAAQVVWEANPEGRMTGQSLGGLPAGGWPLAVHPDERAAAEREWRRSLNSGASLDCEFRFYKSPGGWRWTNVRAAPLRDRRGTIRKWVGMNIDINAQKQAEQELRAARDELEQHVAERTAELEVRANQLAKLTAELTRAEQAERRRLAGVLHDHLQQLLAAAMISVEMIAQEGTPASAAAASARASVLLTEALEASRSLMVELSPPILKESLCAALEWLCFVWMKEKHGLEVSLTTDPQADSPNEDICTAVFLAVRELLFNIVKHANVDHASVILTIDDDDFLHATVDDRGNGFDPAGAIGTTAAANSGTGLGLFGLSERLSMIGGRLEVESRKGDGTRITVVVPRVI